MLKTNKKGLILSSVAILLPMLAGLCLWDRLPAQMTVHWGADGAADGWGHKALAVFGFPVLLLAVQWLCVWITEKDNRKREQSRKVMGMVLWIIPLLSWFTAVLMYSYALGLEPDPADLTLLLMGILFAVLGNYLPKCRQNRTIGIKIKWTLEDEANWNATHRLCGPLWVTGGLLCMVCVFLPDAVIPWVLIVLLTVLAVVPVVYSYAFYRKRLKSGAAVRKPTPKTDKRVGIFTAVTVSVLLLGVLVLMFTGDIRVECGEEAFTVKATYDPGVTVRYDAVDSVEFRGEADPGSRTFGFGTPRLSMGTFQNAEFGSYTRYAYTQCPAEVVLISGEKVLVLSGRDAAETKALYETLSEKIG